MSRGIERQRHIIDFTLASLLRRKGKNGALFNDDWMAGFENLLPGLVSDGTRYAHVVRVYDVEKAGLYLMADIVSQTVLCFSASKTDQ